TKRGNSRDWKSILVGRSAHLDVLPEAETPGDLFLGRPRCLIAPGGARVAHAVDHHVIELYAMRAFEVRDRARRFFEPLHAHGGAREISIPAVLDNVLAFRDHTIIDDCFHAAHYSSGWIRTMMPSWSTYQTVTGSVELSIKV